MGNSNRNDHRDTSLNLKENAKKFLKIKEKELIDFFNSPGAKFSKPNDFQNPDKPMLKIYLPNENEFNMHLYIYNIPGLLKKDGLFQKLGETLMIFQLLFKNYRDKNNYEQNFDMFFDAILEVDSAKIYEMIQLNISRLNLLRIKQGLETIMEIFGTENVKSYYKITFGALASIGGTALVSLIGLGIGSALTATAAATTVGILIIIGICGYFIYRKIKNNNINDAKHNYQKIDDFYQKVQDFISKGAKNFCKDDQDNNNYNYIEKQPNDKNLFIIAFEKGRNGLIKDICLFPYLIDKLNSINCPRIGANSNLGSNGEYYYTLLEACKSYVEEFAGKIEQYTEGYSEPYLQNKIIEVFNFLKTAKLEDIQAKIPQKGLSEEQKAIIQGQVMNKYKQEKENDEFEISTSNIDTTKNNSINGNQIYQPINYYSPFDQQINPENQIDYEEIV